MIGNKYVSVSVLAVVLAVLLLPGFVTAGSLEPSAAPAPTMKTLDEIPPTWSQYLTEAERFEYVLGGGNQAVLDKETGLVWAQSPNTNILDWFDAMNVCVGQYIGERFGWRVPTVEEFRSIMSPFFPVGKFAENSFGNTFWTSTDNFRTNLTVGSVRARTVVTNTSGGGSTGSSLKTELNYVWCVRGGQGRLSQ